MTRSGLRNAGSGVHKLAVANNGQAVLRVKYAAVEKQGGGETGGLRGCLARTLVMFGIKL